MLAIMETQKKYENFCISESYKYLMGMRDMQDKKGGGLMVLTVGSELLMAGGSEQATRTYWR